MNADNIDIKKFRDSLLVKEHANEQNRIRAAQSVETISKIFSNITEEDKELFRSRNIFLDELLEMDLDRVYKDREYHRIFITKFGNIINDIIKVLEIESSDI